MEQSINPHAYCRLRFDEAAEEAIENLANVLQWHRNSAHEGLFVAQKDARAGTSLARQSSSSFVFERIRSIFFVLCACLCVCVSLSLSPRARFDEREGERRLSSFSFFSSLRGCAIARVVRKREMERWKIFSKRRSPLEKEFGDLVLRAPDKDTERERESDRFDERVDIRNDPA
jgi:hypothetical protein